jgi:ribosomal protein S18 acetylase RimI-like enzyme
MDIPIRNFVPSDLADLKRITVEAFSGVSIDRRIEEHFGVIKGHDWRWRKARHIDDDVSRDPAGIFVAELEGRVVGYITTWIDDEAGLGFIPNLAIDEQQRGQGLGRRLIEYALDHFRRKGVRHVRIETLAHNEIGQHLYPSCGFREVARQIHYCLCLDGLPTK